MDLNRTFAQVMKKLFFFLCIVLLVSFMPSRTFALNTIPSHNFEIVRYNPLYISNHTQDQLSYFDAYLLEEDQDDISTSEKEKFSPEKNTFPIISFITTNFQNNVNRISFPNYFFHCSQPGIIYFRVLRL
jgi:hypothetical protein